MNDYMKSFTKLCVHKLTEDYSRHAWTTQMWCNQVKWVWSCTNRIFSFLYSCIRPLAENPMKIVWLVAEIQRGGGGGGGGDHLYFKLDIILVKGLSKHTLNTYFWGMKIDRKYKFLHAFFVIFPSCPFQNLSIWPKTHLFFPNFAHFCTPKRCTRVQCLVLKNNPNYVNFFTRLISNFKYKWPPREIQAVEGLQNNRKQRKCFLLIGYLRINICKF